MTPVEWLEKKLIESGVNLLSEEFEFIEQAKEMERAQKQQSFQDGQWDIAKHLCET